MIDVQFQIVVPGYSHIRLERGVSALVATACTGAVRDILEQGSLYDYAARNSGQPPMQGRGPAYVLSLPFCGLQVVVRRNRRGGALRHILSDQFFFSTRAIRELDNALYLREMGIPTPDIVALVTYRKGWLRRADVATRYIPNSMDLAKAYNDATPEQRGYIIDAAAELLDLMARRGVYHPDLNARNILITPFEDDYRAYVLDVDRVLLDQKPDHARQLNLARLTRSATKFRWPREAIEYLVKQANG